MLGRAWGQGPSPGLTQAALGGYTGHAQTLPKATAEHGDSCRGGWEGTRVSGGPRAARLSCGLTRPRAPPVPTSGTLHLLLSPLPPSVAGSSLPLRNGLPGHLSLVATGQQWPVPSSRPP